jgi:hypothetical protein
MLTLVAGQSCAIERRTEMTHATNDDATTCELSLEELDSVAGGFTWGGLLKALGGGAITGGLGGAAIGGIGAAPGAVGGGLLAGIGYCFTSLRDD